MTAATFWLFVVIAVMAWYSCITVYVAIKGAADIKHMLRRLEDLSKENGNPKP